MRDVVSIPCRACPEQLRLSDEVCRGCGREVTTLDRAALHQLDYEVLSRDEKVRDSAKWIGVSAILIAAVFLFRAC
jgi:hypothetical protein